MIKTEAKRHIVKTNYTLPDDVQKRLQEWNRENFVELDLLFDEGTNKWQFYKVKAHGAIPDDDLLCWQMSVPVEGTGITPGVFDWLKKYDSSNGGLLDEDELKKQWLKNWKQAKDVQREQQEKKRDTLATAWEDVIKKLTTLRTQISVPRTVGMKNGKPIMAVPKGTAKALRRSKNRSK
jgi:hypothetical protein